MKTLYFMIRLVLATFVCGLVLMPVSVSAQENSSKEVASYDMIFRALNLKSAGSAVVIAENPITDKGNSSIQGDVRSLKSENKQVRMDLSHSFSAIDQLPCVELTDTDLGGKTYEPGVYCLNSARLSGELVLNGNNDPSAIFVFRVRGSFVTEKDSIVTPVNNAQPASTFFVADDAANVGENSTLKGNLFARNSIFVGDGATIEGKALSLSGDVALNGNVLAPQVPGFIEICKEIDTTNGTGLENRFFAFKIGALTVEVPSGQCSGPIQLEAGPVQIVEQNSGRTYTNGTFGTFSGNFELTGVQQLNNVGQSNTSALTSFNLPQRTANVNIFPGDISTQTRIHFTNRFAITGIVEICKEGLDSGVNGFFSFTINGVTNGNSTVNPTTGAVTPAPLAVFAAPVGGCSGPLSVVVPSDVNSATPRTGTITINELPRAGYIFTSATTAIGNAGVQNRLVNFNVLANGGGNATVRVVEGGTNLETTVFFNNRTAPGQIKVCKTVGPNVPEYTPFIFTVTGTAPLAAVETVTPVSVSANTQNPSLGLLQIGAVPQGGSSVQQEITVIAGAVQGGFCQIVPGEFVVGTTTTVTENKPRTVTIAGTNVTGAVRVSRINSTTGISQVSPSGDTGSFVNLTRAPNSPFYPPVAGSASSGANAKSLRMPVVRGISEVEFVNTAFSAVPLKICKVAGAGVTVGTPFTFTVTTDTYGGLIAPFSTTLTVLAGPPAVNPGDQSGYCDFATGPFTNSPINGLGSFNFNTKVTITENAAAGFAITNISSPSGSVIANLSNRTAIITNMVNGINEVQFTNTAFEFDDTPPVITPTVSGTQGNNGFYTSNVTISWSVSDAQSSITSTTGCGATTISADTAGTVFTCSASSSGGSATNSVTVKRDATAPTLTFSAPSSNPNAAGWYKTNVSFPYTASDTVSGVSASTPSGTLLIDTEGNAVTKNVTINDNAGNSATFSSPAVKIDKTAPILSNFNNNTVDLSGSGDPNSVSAAVNYDFSVMDNLDPAPSTTCNPVSGSIFQLGSTNVTCGAVDAAGNNAAAKVFQVNVLKTLTNAGTNVPVAPAPNLSLNFNTVEEPPAGTPVGVTTATALTQSEPLPSNFALIGSPILYDIHTTAVFTGNITITFVVPNITNAAACGRLRILHFTGENWDPSNNAAPVYNSGTQTCTVSQIVSSLSPFVIAGLTYEGDVSPRGGGNGAVSSTDVSIIQGFQLSLGLPYQGNEFQRADCAPVESRGDGRVSSIDVSQAQAYQLGFNLAAGNTLQLAAGQTCPISGCSTTAFEFDYWRPTQKTEQTSAPENSLSPRGVRVGATGATSGQTVTVPIQVDAIGDESVYGFSLSYDQTQLSNPLVSAGTAGGSVLSNTQTDGKIAVSVAFTGSTIAAGSNQLLVKVQFTVAAGKDFGTTPLAFADSPTVREVAGSPKFGAIQALPTTFTDGTLTISTSTKRRR